MATGLSFVLVVMPAAHASRDHSKKSTLRERNRLREKCLQAKFSGRRRPRDSRGPHCGDAYLFGFSIPPRTRSTTLREIPSSAVTILAKPHPGADFDHWLDVISEAGALLASRVSRTRTAVHHDQKETP